MECFVTDYVISFVCENFERFNLVDFPVPLRGPCCLIPGKLVSIETTLILGLFLRHKLASLKAMLLKALLLMSLELEV